MKPEPLKGKVKWCRRNSMFNYNEEFVLKKDIRSAVEWLKGDGLLGKIEITKDGRQMISIENLQKAINKAFEDVIKEKG